MKKYSDVRMHTAEHILNRSMVLLFDFPRCFSSHIERKLSKCDYRIDRALTDEELTALENRVNEIIEQDLPVCEEFVTRQEAERRCSLRRLPESAGNNIRLIKVGDYDTCPCIGKHVTSTKEIGKFKINTTSYNDGVFRIRFKVFEGS